MPELVLIAHNLRSSHNVGSLLRTAEGLGIQQVFLTGYTPYPFRPSDKTRLPHIARKVDAQIAKTALGAQESLAWEHRAAVEPLLDGLRQQGFTLVAVEQAVQSIPLPDYQPAEKLALLVGREVEGIEPALLTQVDLCLEIPMFGRKESFNVAQAAAMALYHCRFGLHR